MKSPGCCDFGPSFHPDFEKTTTDHSRNHHLTVNAVKRTSQTLGSCGSAHDQRERETRKETEDRQTLKFIAVKC